MRVSTLRLPLSICATRDEISAGTGDRARGRSGQTFGDGDRRLRLSETVGFVKKVLLSSDLDLFTLEVGVDLVCLREE